MGEHLPRIGVKYCGGCNPRYDRAALVARLSSALTPAHLVPAVPGEEYDALLVVCGCAACCADTGGLYARIGGFTLSDPAQAGSAEEFLRRGWMR